LTPWLAASDPVRELKAGRRWLVARSGGDGNAFTALCVCRAQRQTAFDQAIGIRFNHKERQDVGECGIREGWVKVSAGKTLDRKGHPLMITFKCRVEAFYR